MTVAGLILGWALIGQAPDDVLPPLSGTERKAPAVLQSLNPSDAVAPPRSASPETSHQPRRPPELVDEAILLPSDGRLEGRQLTLLESLGSTVDRRRQLEIVRAYWRLFETTARYNHCLQYIRRIDASEIGGEGPSLSAARAEAAARLQAAKLDTVRSQFELAALAQMASDAPLPLPSDPPHVGAYRTYFNQLFAGRSAPESVLLAEKILPLQRLAIDQLAAAVLAAEDALSAVVDDHRGGRVDAAAVVACNRELFDRRLAFVKLVCDYNRAIADYGLTVVSPTAGASELVAVLIGPARQAANPRSTGEGDTVRVASANEPTAAPPREQWRPNEPTLAPPREGLRPAGDNEPTLAPPRDQPRYGNPNPAVEPLEPVAPQAAAPPLPERIAEKPANFSNSALTATTPLYPALQDASPQARATQLTEAIHWDRYLPKDVGKPIELKEALLRNSGGDRLKTINAYWRLRRRASQYQILAEQVEFYEALMPAALERRNDPTGAADMLRLNAALLAAKAELGVERTALVEAQFDLALLIGATGEPQWPLASTVPHSGDYMLKLDAQPEGLRNTWAVRRLAATVTGQHENVRQCATAVVEAEKARVESAKNYCSGRATIGGVLESIASQTKQTEVFLDSLLQYNRSIAEYALTVLPAATTAERLVVSLVVEQ
ncbi:MAG: hypothetical protein JW959_06730 [Pirellulales bacterium]|nr:hypothetical protein [Pirellulales bacterium]